jgi:alginate O-acetyltransferase complex protein AlgI
VSFASLPFLLLLAVTFPLYWCLRRRGQNLLLLAASLLFYGWWSRGYLLLLLAIAGTDFLTARLMDAAKSPARRRLLLAVSLASNLGALVYFKYALFLRGALDPLLTSLGVPSGAPGWQVILPLGVSFYTFQALSYTLDVYRRRIAAVESPVEYLCFVTFFPHMVAGPIQQATHFLTQFHEDRRFDRAEAADGLRQMLWGFFKKLALADVVAPYVSAAYDHPAGASGWALLWATYLFAFQIYWDFSGYTDIAIGCARLFGLNMTRNFAYPYFARNIRDFWRRWHISLSTWFREYLYVPLGGSRHGRWTTLRNLLIVFAASGLWHGANWTFLAWGLLHGLLFCAWRLLQGERDEKPPLAAAPDDKPLRLLPEPGELLGMALTFQLVCVGWVFFRAPDVGAAAAILQKMAGAILSARPEGLPLRYFLLAGAVFAVEWVQRFRPHPLAVEHLPRPARWACYYAVALAILLLNHAGTRPFIYFQF